MKTFKAWELDKSKKYLDNYNFTWEWDSEENSWVDAGEPLEQKHSFEEIRELNFREQTGPTMNFLELDTSKTYFIVGKHAHQNGKRFYVTYATVNSFENLFGGITKVQDWVETDGKIFNKLKELFSLEELAKVEFEEARGSQEVTREFKLVPRKPRLMAYKMGKQVCFFAEEPTHGDVIRGPMVRDERFDVL